MLAKKEFSNKTKEFLSLFSDKLYCYIPDNNDSKPVLHSEILDLNRQDEGYGIFFSVNGFKGRRTTENIICINGFFCDIDYPDKVNRTPDAIRQFKNELIQELADPDTSLLPTAMVETKNGLHIYWLLTAPIFLKDLNTEQIGRLLPKYKEVLEAILYRYDGDPNAKDLTRVLRVPETLHQKDPKDPFEVKLIFLNTEQRYKFSEISQKFLAKPAADPWAEVNTENPLSAEIKKAVEKEYPRLDRPSYKKLLDKQGEIPEGFRNKALLIAAHACKEAGWSLQQTYDYFNEYHGLSIHEIRKTIRSAFDHAYEFGYNNPVMEALVTPEERQQLSEATSRALGTKGKEDYKAKGSFQKEIYYNYEQVIAQRYPTLKYKKHGDFYRYENGVYKPLSPDDVRSIFFREMAEDGLTNYRKVSAVNDKIACFKSLENRTFEHKDENPDKNIINVLNGLLNVETKELHPHTPDYLSTNQVPIVYDPAAHAPRWSQFVREIMDSDMEQVRLLQQLAGYCLTTDTSFAKAFIFYGSGANGKSLFNRIITKLVGQENVSHLNLTAISRQFGLTGLIGRKVNLIDEISGNYFESDMIKNLISGERIIADIKYRPEPIEFTPVAKMIFSVNELPKINDTTPGLYRRFIVIPFLVSFLKNPDITLEAKLTDELPGIMNWAIEGLQILRSQGYFTETQKNLAALQSFKYENSPMLEFLDRYYEPADPAKFSVLVSEFYQQYKTFCLDNGYKPKAMANLMKEVAHAPNDGWNISKDVGDDRKIIIRGIRPLNTLHGERIAYPAQTAPEPDGY